MMRIMMLVIFLMLIMNAAAFKRQDINHDEIFGQYLRREKRQATLYDDEETTFFNENEPPKALGRSTEIFGIRTVLDGAPESRQIIRLRVDKETTAYEGRVEVYDAKSKRWGLICDDYWNLVDANVTCRHLGFYKAAREATRDDRHGRGIWTENDYTMHNIQCTGKERNIFNCPHEMATTCSGKSAGVSCVFNVGCPKNWLAFNGACYQVNTVAMEYKKAEKFCQDHNSKLAYILKSKENNFISNILYTQHKRISKIWTGGYYAEVKLDEGRVEYRWNWYSTIHNVDQWNTSNLWFPGFSSSQTDKRPQGDPKKNSCVALNRVFTDSERGKTYDVNYFWWDNLSCNEILPFICQMNIPKTRSDCYDDNGFEYRGRISRTVQGSSCERWDDPSATVNAQTNPNAGLGNHNFCRNPDNDIQPWCWTKPSEGVYGYCAIAKCSEMPQEPVTVKPQITDPAGFGNGGCMANKFHCPSMIPYNSQCIHKNDVCDKNVKCEGKEDENPEFCKTYLCKENEFFCAADMFCILKSHLCDGKRNCADGSDERNCATQDETTVLKLYEKFDRKILKLDEKIEYINLPLDKCMEKCKVMFHEFQCKSFNFLPQNETRPYSECTLLLKIQSEEPDKLIDISFPGAHYSSKADCTSDQFKCSRGMCIPIAKKCDQRDDCGDNSDETGCAAMTYPSFEIRLSGSANKWEGKVEVRYQGEWGFVCDNGFDINSANVVCKQLGFLGAMESVHYAVNRFGKSRAPNIILDEVKCTGSELSVDECPHGPWRSHNCRPDQIAGVVCKVDRACLNTEFRCKVDKICISISKVCDKVNDCSDGSDEPEGRCTISAALVNGPDSKSGIVILSRADSKGTVCDDGYDDNDAKVLCKMLGIPGRAEAVQDRRFGEGSGSIVMGNLRCTGDEDNVENCPGFKWGSHKCTHKEDIGLLCGLPERVVTTTPAIITTLRVAQDKNLTCGKRYIAHKRGRVVGGFNAIYGAFPWQVGVRLKSDDYDSHWCGASILSEDWIISAAHCYAYTKNDYRVRTGDFDNSADNNDKYEEAFEIEELILHPQWDRSNYDYDMALIKVERKNGKGIQFSNYVQPVCLPKVGMVPDPNTKCLVSGWGDTQTEYPEQLLAAEVPLIRHQRCVEFYRDRLTERMQCAGYEAGGIDTCQGDSGGPLVCLVNGVYTIFGATSWGNGCAQPRNPGVYAKIQVMLSWVKEQTNL